MTGFDIIVVEALVMPLGPLSDSIPHGTDVPIRCSPNEMRQRITGAQGIPVTLSRCRKRHAPKPVGFVQKFRIADNGLWMIAHLWSGVLPNNFDFDEMGCSPEFKDAIQHCNWMRDFKLNAVALVRRKDAAFTSTHVRILRKLKCTDKTRRAPAKQATA